MYTITDKKGMKVVSTSDVFVARVASKFVDLGLDGLRVASASMITKYIHDQLGGDEYVIVNWIHENYDSIERLSLETIVVGFKEYADRSFELIDQSTIEFEFDDDDIEFDDDYIPDFDY